jgi:N6-L-threonylcarbamoyladenine synthase
MSRESVDRENAGNPIRILGIESSCDETAASVVESGRLILSNVVASQIDLHAQYGGVFPEVASRQHILSFTPVVEQALSQAHLNLSDVDAIAVTRGPGLPGSLVIGVNIAKGLSLGSGRPIVGINHLEAHLYSIGLYRDGEQPVPNPEFPLVALIVSGGHTELVLMEKDLDYRSLGVTLDDAAGEAFDKVARLIGLSYPGGPSIQKAAEGGNPTAFNFPRAWLDESLNFSFSGLKTAVLREVRKLEEKQFPLPTADLAASFQKAVIEVLVGKTIKAARHYSARTILISGGVSANQALRNQMRAEAPCEVLAPPVWLCTDNAAMVAAVGCYRFMQGQRDGFEMDVLPNWPISELPSG